MWVEVVKSIALKPTRSITGAMVSVLAVSMPSAPHRLWLPSRSEVSTSATSATRLSGRDPRQHLPVLDHRAVLHQHLDHRAGNLRAHGVHELHHFDDADDAVRLHRRADLHVGLSAGLGRTVEDAHQWRGDLEH